MAPVEQRELPRLQPVPPGARQVQHQDPTFAEYLGVLAAGRWLISVATALGVMAAVAYVILATPIYRSDLLVQVEERDQGLGMEGLAEVFSASVPADTEMEIIRSRSLVGAVVDELQLDVEADPRTFPLIGGAVFRARSGSLPRSAVFGLGRFAWGGERIAIGQLDVPDALLDVPLTLVAGENGSFDLLGPDDGVMLRGHAGALAVGGGAHLLVTDLVARPGTEFVLTRRMRAKAVSALQRDLRASERGRNTGIVQVTLEGEDPKRIAAILDAAGRTYVRQNIDRRSAEAQKTLEFVETQLPNIRKRVESAEAALEAYRAKKGDVNVSLQTEATLTRAVELERGMSELEVQRAELEQRFTGDHPLLASVKQKIHRLQADRAAIDARLKKLPLAELESARLLRDANVANELYVLLLNRAEELRVVKSGTIGNVRVLDTAAVPFEPVAPKKPQTLALGLVLGIVFGVSLAVAKRALNRGVEDPEAVEREVGLPVYAIVPRSEREVRMKRAERAEVLATVAPADIATESLRSLRTSLQFALVDAPNGAISVLGCAPSVGKTFLSVNLAAVLAQSGKRVLLVDGDLRKGRIHRFFGGRRDNGLSELITGTVGPQDVIRTTPIPQLQFIASGRAPPSPADLLGSERFGAVLCDLRSRYDHVVIDTAPVLAATDGALVARHTGVNLLVLRAGQHPMREISAAVRGLEQSGVRVNGVVLNDVQIGMVYNRYHYRYAYDQATPGE